MRIRNRSFGAVRTILGLTVGAILGGFSPGYAQLQFHGVTVQKGCNGPGGTPEAREGQSITCVIRVTNDDEAGHTIRVMSIVDVVHHKSGDRSTGNLLATPIDIAPGASADATHTDTVDVGDNDPLVDTATVEALDLGDNGSGTDPAGGSVEAQVDVLPTPDVGVLLATSTPSISAGDTAVYNMTVTANGPGASEQVVLTDNLPSGLVWTPSGPDAAACTVTGGTMLHCDFGTLNQGATRQVTVSAMTTADSCPSIQTTAMVSALVDAVSGNNQAGPVTIAVDCPDAGVDLSTPTSSITAGEDAVYNMVVTANGPGTSKNVTLSNALPGGLTWILGGPDAGNCSIGAGNVLSCNFGNMTPPDTRQITVTAMTGLANCGTLQDSVSIAATIDTVAANNQDGPVAIVINCPDVSVKASTPTPVINVGEPAIYNFMVTSNGPGTSQNVMMSAPLPPGLTWTPSGPDAGSCSIGAGNVLKCNFGTLPPGSTPMVTVTATPGGNNCGTLQTTATVTATLDAIPSNNTAGPVDILVNCPDAKVTLSTPTPAINAGDTAIYDLVVMANGPGPSKTVVLLDPLPTGLTWVPSGPDAGACSIDANNQLSCDFGTIPQGESRTVRVSAETTTANCGTIRTTASITAMVDTNPANNVSGPVAITIACSGGCRITGGGWFNGITDPNSNAETRAAHFGGQVGAPCGCLGCFDDLDSIQGSFHYDRKNKRGSLHAKDYNSLVCALDGGAGPEHPTAPANKICFTGVADYNPSAGNKTVRVAFRVEAEDRGEPGTNDRLHMRIWIPVLANGETPESLADQACCTKTTPEARTPDVDDDGTLVGGNVQIHEALRKSTELQCPVPRGMCMPK